jgi:hypothetical protein
MRVTSQKQFSVVHPEIRYLNWNCCSPSAQILQKSFPVSGQEIVLLNRNLCFISLRPANCRFHDGRCILFAAFRFKRPCKSDPVESLPEQQQIPDNKKTYENLIHNPFNVLKSAIRFEPSWVVSFGGGGHPHPARRAGSVR